MNPLLINSSEFNIESENACRQALGKFDTNYIYDVMKFAIQSREVPQIISPPNLVSALDHMFADHLYEYEFDQQNTIAVKIETYKEIINKLCQTYNFEFIDYDNNNYDTISRYMYDLLVCNYINDMVVFFTDYINLYKNEIYDNLQLVQYKADKTSENVYNKKKFSKDIKLSMIMTRLPDVISFILGIDIQFNQILDIVYKNQLITNVLISNIREVDDFYNQYKKSLAGPYGAAIMAMIQTRLVGIYNI